jgi:hypothetical protein
MVIGTIVTLIFGLLIAVPAAIYCFKPDMIVRQVNETAHRSPRLLHFALPIAPRQGRITARQVRSTGLGLFLLSAWFLIVAFLAIIAHH